MCCKEKLIMYSDETALKCILYWLFFFNCSVIMLNCENNLIIQIRGNNGQKWLITMLSMWNEIEMTLMICTCKDSFHTKRSIFDEISNEWIRITNDFFSSLQKKGKHDIVFVVYYLRKSVLLSSIKNYN